MGERNKSVILQERLENKKAELKQKQEQFEVLFHNEKDSACYERNAINDLISMMQLKNEIREIEYGMMLKE